jgi:hypothetical protein
VPRLPTPGGDAGAWAAILNDYLKVSHAADGTLAASLTIGGDAILYRSGAGTLKTDGTFGANQLRSQGYLIANDNALAPVVGVGYDFNGNQFCGIGFTYDTTLYRFAAGCLRTDAQMWASAGITTFIKAGALSNADFGANARDGLIGIDVANGRLYYRAGGSWRYLTGT